MIDIALPFTHHDPGRPAGQSLLLPDFNSVRLFGTEQAVVFCYFGNAAPLCAGLDSDPYSFVAPMCPRRPLYQALVRAQQLGLKFRVGFELEFSRTQEPQAGSCLDQQVHQSSGLRSLKVLMLPVLCTITDTLEKIGIPIEQFHCEGSANAYELVMGPLPPLEAVDALTTCKETARRICNDNNIHLLFNPTMPEINGLHMTLSVECSNSPVDTVEDYLLAGVIEHMKSLCAFALVRPESYDRTVRGQWCAGRYIAWGTDNREVPIRKRGPGCWEMRLPDAAAQVYMYLAAVLTAGIAGIENKTPLKMKDCPVDPAVISDDERRAYGITAELPSCPNEAYEALQGDPLMADFFGKELINIYVAVQQTFNKQLEEVGSKGSKARRAWLSARI